MSINIFDITEEGIYWVAKVTDDLPLYENDVLTGTIKHEYRNIWRLNFNSSSPELLYDHNGYTRIYGYFANGKFIGQVKYEIKDTQRGYFTIVDLRSGVLTEIPIP